MPWILQLLGQRPRTEKQAVITQAIRDFVPHWDKPSRTELQLDAVFLQLPVQGRLTDAEQLCRYQLVSIQV